jgi:hypothetical protein
MCDMADREKITVARCADPRPSGTYLAPQKTTAGFLGIDDRGGDPRPPLDLLQPMDSKFMNVTPPSPATGNWRSKLGPCGQGNWRNNGPEMLDGPQ